MTILTRYIDYDFTDVPDGQSTGLIEQSADQLLSAFVDVPWFDEICAEDMVPRSEWKARAAAASGGAGPRSLSRAGDGCGPAAVE